MLLGHLHFIATIPEASNNQHSFEKQLHQAADINKTGDTYIGPAYVALTNKKNKPSPGYF